MLCRLCQSLQSSSELREEWNVPVAESRNFLALPSLGSLVPGWTLIVPKQHFYCFSALPDAMLEEVSFFKKQIQTILGEQFGKTVVFEHGSPKPTARMGCGVDHAHLHVVPFSADLKSLTHHVSENKLNWQTVDNFSEIANCDYNGLPYFYLECNEGNRQLAFPEQDESQLFRKAIAFSLGRPESFDWKLDPCLSNIRTTAKAFSDSIAFKASVLK